MKASDYIAQFFADKGINVVFGYIGGMITHLVDSIDKNPNIRFIQTYHEQTAAIAAEGYALESGKPGIAIATSGPGATNLMTGIADAYFGNIPTIFITGQVNTYEYKYDKPIRQQGFQETDVVSIVKPITKYAVMVDDASMLRYELEKAYHIASTGRKGPVLIDLPMNISRAEIEPETMLSFSPSPSPSADIDWHAIAMTLKKSKSPLILIGGGCFGESELVNKLIAACNAPFVTSLMGRSIADESSPLYCGMIGSYGNRCANMIISQCDVLLAVGSRLDTRQTGARIEAFNPECNIIHVDIDRAELDSHRLPNRITVNAAANDFINQFINSQLTFPSCKSWIEATQEITRDYNQQLEVERFVENKAPYSFFVELNKILPANAVITTDIGQNQMWAAQALKLSSNHRFYTSGGLAPMGFSLPVAIGAAFASPDKPIYCINGDGGFHMACQSLLLISQYNLNIKVIILNNEALGMITQFQHLYFNDNMAGTTAKGGYLTPDLRAMAAAYHLPYEEITQENLDPQTLREILKQPNLILNYIIHGLTTVAPKLEYNQPLFNPSPYLPEEELEKAIRKLQL